MISRVRNIRSNMLTRYQVGAAESHGLETIDRRMGLQDLTVSEQLIEHAYKVSGRGCRISRVRNTISYMPTGYHDRAAGSHGLGTSHVGLSVTYRYKRTGQFFIWNYIGNWYVFSNYLDNYCRYQYCANDTLFRNISSIFRSIFQDIFPKKDVAFCETTDTAHSYIKQIVNLSEINVSIDA